MSMKSILGLTALSAMNFAQDDELWPSNAGRLVSSDEPNPRKRKPKAVQKRRAKNKAARKARKANRT